MKLLKQIISQLAGWIRLPSFFNIGASIRTKLLVAFLVMIGLTLSVSIVTLMLQERTRLISQELDTGYQIVANALEAERYALESRKSEKDFLLNYKTIGLKKAQQYADQVSKNVAEFYESVGRVSDFAETKSNKADRDKIFQRIDIVYQSVYDYETAFNNLAYELKARGKKGLAGQNVENDPVIRAIMASLHTEAQKISPLIDDMVNIAKSEEASQKENLRNIEEQAKKTSMVAAFIAIVLGLLLAFYLSGSLTKQVKNIMNLFNDIGMGDFSSRADILTRDELGAMAQSLNAMLDNTLSLIQSREERDNLQSSIMTLLEEISALQDGDLSARAVVTAEATGALADSFNAMAEQLGGIVTNVKDAAIQVTTTSKDVKTSTDHLAESSEQQAVQITDAIAAINEMATSIQQVAEHATKSAQVSQESTTNAKEGSEAVDQTSQAMESIRDNVQETARSIKRLGESSQEIGNIVQIINDIAERTSILALNASIQAAMAGDAGRGFAVVAEEVQRLAERSTNSTKQIETLVTNIQGEINEAGTSMEESIQKVVDGTNLASNARNKLKEIEEVSSNLGELVQSITMAAQQQARASENIAKTMEEVGEVSSQNQAASSQTAVAMQKMAETADLLHISVSEFKLAAEKEQAMAEAEKATQELRQAAA